MLPLTIWSRSFGRVLLFVLAMLLLLLLHFQVAWIPLQCCSMHMNCVNAKVVGSLLLPSIWKTRPVRAVQSSLNGSLKRSTCTANSTSSGMKQIHLHRFQIRAGILEGRVMMRCRILIGRLLTWPLLQGRRCCYPVTVPMNCWEQCGISSLSFFVLGNGTQLSLTFVILWQEEAGVV